MSPLKQIGLLVLLGGLAAGGYEGWKRYYAEAHPDAAPMQSKAERPVQVEVEPATYREVETNVEAVGSSRAHRTVEITPYASGRVIEVNFSAGKRVEAGEVLLRLDNDIQRADLAEAEARLTEAESALKRAETLKRTNTVAASAVDKLIAEAAIAKAERDRARSWLRDRTVVAPFDGVVGYSNVEIGAQVSAGDMITVLDDLSVIEVEFSLPEALFGQIQAGQRGIADAAPFPGRVFDAEIVSIDSRIEPISRAFKARALIANSDGALPAGMFMHLTVVLGTETVLTLPEEAVVVDGNQAYVNVVTQRADGERTSRRNITMGRRSYGFIEILSGVSDGDLVVTRGVQKVRENTLVKRRDASPAVAGNKDAAS